MSPSTPVIEYASEFQAVEPLPIFALPVSVSKPNSPEASVGFAEVHDAAVPRRN
jgi:hypothetical protein